MFTGETLQLSPETRFVDVESHRLVQYREMGDDTIPAYAALSYVWGDLSRSHQLRTLRSNLAGFGKRLPPPHSSTSDRNTLTTDRLPNTIRGAMAVAHELGFRYLWVDALCIVQDDGRDQKIQIEQMSAIYRQALVTIVNSGGSDSDSGIPGISIRRTAPGLDAEVMLPSGIVVGRSRVGEGYFAVDGGFEAMGPFRVDMLLLQKAKASPHYCRVGVGLQRGTSVRGLIEE